MDATNRNTALASAMVEELARCGLRHAVIAPGSRSTPLALALWREPAIEVSVIVDERSAAFFALGAAQATQTPVAVLCTSGTAAANLHPAVCEADESAVPLIVLTADRPPELRGIGAGQTIDQLKLYGHAVRWFCEVGTHEADDAGLVHFRSVACRAFAVAAGDARPGPVHLNVPWRDPLGPEPRADDVTARSTLAREGRADRPLTSVEPALPGSSTPLLDDVAGRLRAAPRGLIVAGRQGDPELAEALVSLAEATGYPILAEPTSQLRCGRHSREAVVTAYDAIARIQPSQLAPELVIRAGEMPTSKALRQWLAELECDQVVLARDGWNEPTRRATTILRAEPATLARQLASWTTRDGSAFRSAWIAAANAAMEAVDHELDSVDHPTEPGFWRALGGELADGELVYTASSMPIRDQEAFLPGGDAEALFLANRGANGIDGLVSSGIGAATASGRPAWIVTGDLGLFHDMNALATLRHARVPVRIVVLNNDGGGIFEFLPQAGQIERDEFEALLGTPLGLDYERVAGAFGVPHVRIEDLGELKSLPAETGLIEVPVERSENLPLHRRLADVAAAAVRAVAG
ncbi:MAG: 2-succinyl-5-enolpyruvyl-6-hydroxy-3-cyclohexene-carboxylate synthase [Sphingomonadales bacterium]|nr:2-succinyl-5-enolpyruvyl-6-hydroxy-3-cyclohexene-carboxylate synthase [Sphingomonadales bacterium]